MRSALLMFPQNKPLTAERLATLSRRPAPTKSGRSVHWLGISLDCATWAAKLLAMIEKATVTLPGTVEKIVPSPHPALPEKAQISVEGADHLYKEIRIENNLKDEKGQPVKLKEGAEVEVTVEAPSDAVIPASKESEDSNPESGKHK